MFKIGEVVSYSATGVCEIIDIRHEKLTDQSMEYYILKPFFHNSSTVYVPLSNETLVSRMKYLLSEKGAEDLIVSLNVGEPFWIENDNERLTLSREILRSGDRYKIASLIRCLYLRSQKLTDLGKHLRTADAQILKEAQLILHGEIATVFNISINDVENFITEKLSKTAE